MYAIVVLLTENSLDKSLLRYCPEPLRRRISITSLSDSLRDGCNSPLCDPPLRFRCRFLDIMSRMFSFCVPRNRCDGLQHNGLSHLWQTSFSLSMNPHVKAKANRCAGKDLLLNVTFPYPCLDFLNFQSQQLLESNTDTLFQNRSTSLIVNRKNLKRGWRRDRELLDSIIKWICLGLGRWLMLTTSPASDHIIVGPLGGQHKDA
jgi:hypothetical protein